MIPGKSVQVADTISAGDSFRAAYLSKFIKIGAKKIAAETANSVGAFVASQSGSIQIYDSTIRALIG